MGAGLPATSKRLSRLVAELSRRIREKKRSGDLPDYFPRLAKDALLAWVSGQTEGEWIGSAEVNRAEISYLREASVWPWGRDRHIDQALSRARENLETH